MRIAIISNSAWYIYNFRLNKMKMLREKGYAINVLVPWDTKYSNLLLTEGFEVKSWKISRASVNPISEIYSILCLHKLIVLIKPNFIFTYTPKGNIYCNIVGLFSQLKIINNISGMGVISSKMKIFQFLVRVIYKLTLQRKNVVFFQNTNDMNYFIHHKLLKHNKYSLLPGSGVDTLKFVPNTKNKDVYLNFLFMGRLLIEKGLIDLIEAIKFIRFNYTFVQFFVLGMFEPPRSSAIIRSDIDHWVKDGLIRYLGQTDDVHSVLLTMDCLVFPSYYGEGIPRSLLEAASCGLPVITTNHPGCRDAVVDGVTGFLCEPKNPKDLSEKIIQFIN
ncbi:MAG: glycosyltransferase family 4 protein, partial [Mariniphaga sp.]|nr:glycosyltransferase family 4 protein [Mariniphaga sp.]